MLVLTCMEQDDTSISEEVEREISDLLERNRDVNGIFSIGNKLFEFETCEEISFASERVTLGPSWVRCMSYLS